MTVSVSRSIYPGKRLEIGAALLLMQLNIDPSGFGQAG